MCGAAVASPKRAPLTMLTRTAMSLTLVAAAWQARLLLARPAATQEHAGEQRAGDAAAGAMLAAAARSGGADGVAEVAGAAEEEEHLSAERRDALKLWCVLALLRLAEESVERLVRWVPGYSVAKLLLLVQIARAPETARLAFDACVAPTMERLALQVARARAILLRHAVRLLATLTGPGWHEELRAAENGELDRLRAVLVKFISSVDRVLRVAVATEQDPGARKAPASDDDDSEAAYEPETPRPVEKGTRRGK